MAKEFDLGELLKNVPKLDTVREQIEYIRLDLLEQDPNNFYRLSDVEQLADNISLCGLQQPIRVRQQENGRYMIVSGHRRRAAVELLAKEDPERWAEVPCIVEKDAVSPSLQQLRLIYANANTRTMTDAEISEQAVQVEKLLYQLKEEGYEFPGRMRDHVAQAVGKSKSKLARLKVIRDNLAFCWQDAWKSGKLGESVAYALSQAPKSWQTLIFDKHGSNPGTLYEEPVRIFVKRFELITKTKCGPKCDMVCEHRAEMMRKSCIDRWSDPCASGCCLNCLSLRTCKSACSVAQSKKKDLQNAAKKAVQEAAEDQAKRDAPILELILDVYRRVGIARDLRCIDVRSLYEAQGRTYGVADDDEQIALESGEAKISTNTSLPFGYGFYPSQAAALVRVADLLDCSIDYLLGRTEDMRPVAGWQTGDPWNFGEYVVLVRYDSARGPTPEKMSWTEDGWEMLGTAFSEVCSDAVIIGWMPMPEEPDEALQDAIDVIRETGVASVSMLQRRLKIGYAAASDLMDQLEKAGILGPYNGSSPREILIETEAERK